jgi:hypothetical protein
MPTVKNGGLFMVTDLKKGSLVSSRSGPVMVGEGVAPLTATTEPDVRLSPHPALEHQGLCHRHY